MSEWIHFLFTNFRTAETISVPLSNQSALRKLSQCHYQINPHCGNYLSVTIKPIRTAETILVPLSNQSALRKLSQLNSQYAQAIHMILRLLINVNNLTLFSEN